MRVVVSSELDGLEQEIRKEVDAVARDPQHKEWKDAAWTKNLKNKLCVLGQQRGFRAYARTAELANRGEWLYDLTWTNEPAGFLQSVPLVLEMEWSFDGVDDDFQKLVAARATHRVMLFNYPPGHVEKLFIERLLKNVTSFEGTMAGDRYLLGGWVENKDCFDWQLLIVST